MAYSLRYSFDSTNQTYSVYGYSNITENDTVIIPDTYNDRTNGSHSVTLIEPLAFYNCSTLTSIEIGNNITSIGQRAFYECSNLKNVAIGNSVTSIGEMSFQGCSSLTNLTIGNSVTSIGYMAFAYCRNLTSVTIPNSVTSIGANAFNDCRSLTSITIPGSVTSIGGGAFQNCYRLIEVKNLSTLGITTGSEDYGYIGYYAKRVYSSGESYLSTDENGYKIYDDGTDKILMGYTGTETDLTLPSDITQIYEYAFYNCYSLTSVEIPDSVTNIGEYAFDKCNSLTSIIIPGSVTSIGRRAFYTCNNLRQLIAFPLTPPTLGTIAFPLTISSIYVQQSSLETYKSATNWNFYLDKIVSNNLYLSFLNFNQENKKYIKAGLDTKYDKTGGVINGEVVITGDLTVNGTQHINNTDNLDVKNAMIYSNSDGATLTSNGGLGIKTNSTDVYGIVYDPVGDSVKLGLGKSDADGKFTFNANEGNPITVRDDDNKLTNNHLLKWNSTDNKLVDSGKTVDDLSTATNLTNGTGVDSLIQKYIVEGTDYSAQAIGENAIALGGKRYDKLTDTNRTPTSAEGNQSFAAGGSTHAYGDWDFTTGKDTVAYQRASSTFGGNTQAGMTEEEFNAYFWDSANNKPLHSGQGKDSQGNILDSSGSTYNNSYSFAFAEGESTQAMGRSSHAEGNNTQAVGTHAHSEGLETKAEGYAAHSEGGYTAANGSLSHAEGNRTVADGSNSHAEGYKTTASRDNTHAEGSGTTASANNAHAEGFGTVASNSESHAEGNSTTASGLQSHSEGIFTQATGMHSHAEGSYTIAEGENSHAEGGNTKASHSNSHAEGYKTKTSYYNQHVGGQYNKDNVNALFIVGNGESEDTRSNAFEVLKDGRAKVQSAPTESDDVVRKQELDTKLNSSEKSKFVDLTSSQTITSIKNFSKGIQVGDMNCSVYLFTMPSPYNYAYLEWQKEGSSYACYLPESEGTFVVRPNILPTSTSLVQLSSTGTPSYKPIDDFIDLYSTQVINGTKAFTDFNLYTDIIKVMDDNFHLQRISSENYIALRPAELPAEDSIVKYNSSGIPTWKPVSELDGNALKVTVW